MATLTPEQAASLAATRTPQSDPQATGNDDTADTAVSVTDHTTAQSAQSDPVETSETLPSNADDEDLSGLTNEELIAKLREANKAKEEASASSDDGEEEGEETETQDEVDVTLDTVKAGEGSMSEAEYGFFEKEYADGGKLSEESFEAIEARGIPRRMVEQYIAGAEAANAKYVDAVQGPVGGTEGYQALIKWASENMDQAAIDRFNESVNSGDVGRATDAVAGIHARMGGNASKATEPAKTAITTTTQAASDGYMNQAALQKDMSDPRYRSDPNFQQMVAKKIMRSHPDNI